jgi:prepilin-type N-terminal cleavage/methylation domain-containing protein
MRNGSLSKRTGYTLIELIIVMAIISILLATCSRCAR